MISADIKPQISTHNAHPHIFFLLIPRRIQISGIFYLWGQYACLFVHLFVFTKTATFFEDSKRFPFFFIRLILGVCILHVCIPLITVIMLIIMSVKGPHKDSKMFLSLGSGVLSRGQDRFFSRWYSSSFWRHEGPAPHCLPCGAPAPQPHVW